LAKIAVEFEPVVPTISSRVLAAGVGWTVSDIVCTAGPHDRPFEENHSAVSVSVVTAGSFQYRSSGGRELMTPGSVLLGNAGQSFECSHEHGCGDHCIAFQFTKEFFEEIAADAGASGNFLIARLPCLRSLAPLIARACAGANSASEISWEELAVGLAGAASRAADEVPGSFETLPAGALARVTRVVRRIEHSLEEPLSVSQLAREARLSPFHFLRTFERLTGLTPHQYILRTRLRKAAVRLLTEPDRVLDIALDSGFGDVSNFNRAFKAEFGMSPRKYRAA
jgi:AraC-like DNA-binding protein